MNELKLSINSADISSNNVNGIFKTFAQQYPDEISAFTDITEDSEHNLANFGTGSAWMYETGYKLGLEFDADNVTLVIRS